MKSNLYLSKSDLSNIHSGEDAVISNISSQYTAFQSGSTALVKSFRRQIDKHGLIRNIPLEILQKYSIPFRTLLDLSRNLRDDIEREVNKSNIELEYNRIQREENTSINEIILPRRDKLYQQMEYFDDIEILHTAIEFCISIS